MLNLLRMDLRRIFRGKGFYICLGILAFTTIFTFALLYILQNPAIRDILIKYGMTVTSSSGEIEDALSTTSLINLFHQTNISGGLLPVITGILATIFICTDFDSGFIKNILAVHVNKWDYIISKIVSLFLVNLMYLAVTFLTCVFLNVICGNFFTYSSAGDILFYLGSIWMITNAFSTLILLVCMITRNKAAGITAAFILGSGLIVILVSSLLGLFNANEIMNYTLYMNLAECPQSYDGLVTLRPIIVSVIFGIIYTTAGKLVLAKKDI